MKVLLIRPPIYSNSLSFPGGPRFGLPISLLYLAAYLEKENIDVTIYDALIDCNPEEIEPDENGIYFVGAKWKTIIEKTREYQPDIVGITNPFSDFADYALEMAAHIRDAHPEVKIVIGGPHASSSPESFLTSSNAVDYVIRGEGEIALTSLIKALPSNTGIADVAGLMYRENGSLRKNEPAPFIEDLDELPLPAYHLIDVERYFSFAKAGYPSRYMFEYKGSEREVSIITSRGCPYKCVFCGNHLHMGRKWRNHGTEYIIRHMEFLINKYDVRHFHIEDDNVGLNPERFNDLLDGIIEKKWNITWDTPNGVRAEKLSEKLLVKAKLSGCTYLIIGIESGDQAVLKKIIKKNLNLSEVEETAKNARKAKLDLHGFYVVGFPGENKKDIDATFKFALAMLSKYGVIPHLCLARPLPGTELNDICEKNGYFSDPVVPDIGSGFRGEVFSRQMIQTDDFTPA
ncbi:MAG: radical SAM protein, partial [bacterium]|nr:radical SAM protein [bacterium]